MTVTLLPFLEVQEIGQSGAAGGLDDGTKEKRGENLDDLQSWDFTLPALMRLDLDPHLKCIVIYYRTTSDGGLYLV